MRLKVPSINQFDFAGKQCFFVLRQQHNTVQCIAYVSEHVSKQMIKFISQ
jgi:hypothetical protein